MKARCVGKPSNKEFTEINITVGNVYSVKWIEGDDYQIIDDNKKLRWYQQRFFEDCEWDAKSIN